MKKAWVAAAVFAAVPLVLGVFVLALLLVKFLWAWTVPDLFPGAVRQGLIAREISWFTALKVAIFVAVITGFRGGHYEKKS